MSDKHGRPDEPRRNPALDARLHPGRQGRDRDRRLGGRAARGSPAPTRPRPGGSIAEDAVEAAPGVAGTPADDDTAAEVEARPTAVLGKDNPGPKPRGGSRPAPTANRRPGARDAVPPATPATAPAATGTRRELRPARPSGAPPPRPTGPIRRRRRRHGQAPRQPAPRGRPDTRHSPTAPTRATAAAADRRGRDEAERAGPPPTASASRPGRQRRHGCGRCPAGASRRSLRRCRRRRRGAAGAGAGARAAAPPKPPEPDPDEVTALRELVPDLTWERRHGYVEVRDPERTSLSRSRGAVKGSATTTSRRSRPSIGGTAWRCSTTATAGTTSTAPGCVVIRADLPPEPNPLCPSLTTVWAGAELQEREIYDLFGVKFVGHPDLRRILLEDDFPGHPLRKDWTFDYEYVLVKHLKYGAEGQDAPPGWRGGLPPCLKASRSRSWSPRAPNEMTLNMGPQHPSTHGVFRLIMQLDGETVVGRQAGDGLPAPLDREARRGPDLRPGRHPDRSDGLPLADDDQLGLRAGDREAGRPGGARSAPSTSA